MISVRQILSGRRKESAPQSGKDLVAAEQSQRRPNFAALPVSGQDTAFDTIALECLIERDQDGLVGRGVRRQIRIHPRLGGSLAEAGIGTEEILQGRQLWKDPYPAVR